jgi:hypothetical protein
MDKHAVVRLLLIIAAAVGLFALVGHYNSTKGGSGGGGGGVAPATYGPVGTAYGAVPAKVGGEAFSQAQAQYGAADGSDELQPPGAAPESAPSGGFLHRHAAPEYNSVQPNDSADGTGLYRPVSCGDGGTQSGDCFPKDRLTASDLLPHNAADSKWAQVNPLGQGDIHNQNFLTAGYHIGIDTIGESLRNPNLQLRSEPPNPQFKVSPWMQSTIMGDVQRRPLEIGGDY